MASDELNPLLIDLISTEQPSADELAAAPVLDDWKIACADATGAPSRLFARGVVSQNPKFPDCDRIITSAIVAVDNETRWIRTQNTLYVLGAEYDDIPLIMRAACSGSRLGAYIVVIRETGKHTIPHGVYAAALAAGYNGDESDDKTQHDAANAVGDRMAKDGRQAVAEAWWILGCYGYDRKRCDDIHLHLGEALGHNPTAAMREVVAGWRSLGDGRALGEDKADPIAAARVIGVKLQRSDDPLQRLKDAGDVLDEVAIGDDGPGVVVVKAIGGMTRTSAGNDAKAEFREIIGKPVPLVPTPDLAGMRKVLMAEFPYAGRLIDVLLSDLTGRESAGAGSGVGGEREDRRTRP